MFKVKDEYKLELETPESREKTNRQNKIWRQTLEVTEGVLVQCNLVNNQHQQKSKVLYTFMPNKSYACLLNVESNNLIIYF